MTHLRPTTTAALLLSMLVVTPRLWASDREEKKPGELRAYTDGPLSVGDFRGKPPVKSPVNFGIEMVANTECEVRYQYRSIIERKGRDQWTARISDFTCTAILARDKCWNTQPDNLRVLDHEQGHFDLAELAARRTAEHFAGLIRDGKAAAGGRDRGAAERRLEADIEKAMEKVFESLSQAHKTYDEETRHGTALLAQRRHRQWQRGELEKLSAER